MSKMQIPKKIRVEDFSGDNKEVIEKIAFMFNPFADEVYRLMDGNLDTTNLNRQIVDVTVKFDNTGVLVAQPQIKVTTNGRIRGLNVISANNTINPDTYPSSAPFVSFTTNSNILTVLHVSGLQNNSEYKLVLELIV
jgi:hypothetical protein